jgi:SAM-dependent methyltransferase
VLAQLVGADGFVVGIDMTEEQLAVAERHRDWHAARFGYANVEFRHGYIEQLGELGLADASFDVIVSNCVINLVPDKAAVLREAFRLLKPGGELYFSDVYADRRVPREVATDPVLYGECLGGALYWNDLLRLARGTGFTDPRLVEDRPLAVSNEELQAKTGNVRFYSATYRLFKLPGLETECEDYGQAVRYRGTITHHPHRFVLDKHHSIETGRIFPVCGNTWRMLHDTRFAAHFDFFGDWRVHYGLFAGCGGGLPFDESTSADIGRCGC